MIVLLLPIFAVLTICFHLLRPLFSPLRWMPGPFLARFTNFWYFWRVSKGNFETDNIALHKSYGPIVQYGPNRYSFNDPDATNIIYGLGSHFSKSSWYSGFGAPGTTAWNLFSDQDSKRHAHNRKLYQSTYSMSALVNYESYVDECTGLFSQRLAEIAQAGIPIDMGHWFQCYAFDVIGLISFAKRLGFLDQGGDVGGVLTALEGHLVYSARIGVFPSLHPYMYRARNYFAGSKGAGRSYLVNFTEERVQEFRAAPKIQSVEDISGNAASTAEPFIAKFSRKHEQEPEKFTGYHVRAGLVSNMVAGSDTTAISLSAILYYLLKNPNCLERLRDEIDDATAQGQLSEKPTFKESQDLPYLQAVMKEALRLHPATGLPLERIVPPGGATISGHFFPAGTIVGVNTWVENRNTKLFGNDAESFIPTRWLTNNSDELSIMKRHWMPFGLGSRNCIGRHISILEMSKLIPRLLRDFDFRLDESSMGPNGHWKTQNSWFVKPRQFKVFVSLRNSKIK